jgi:tRNA-dihydrouridine synthase
MEGLTSRVFRRTHARFFPGVDRYYAPFLAPDGQGKVKASALRDLDPEQNRDISLVPQILCSRPEAFLALSRELAAMGYGEVNLNAGCPSGTVVPKHKGAGMLADLDSLDRFLAEVFSACPLRVSVKTRLGMESGAEFPRILEIYRRYPLSELIVHARPRDGMYRSTPELGAFAPALEGSPFPVCYNGNLLDRRSYEKVMLTFPELDRLMLGRGAIANPALFRVLRGGPPLEAQELRAFLDALCAALREEGLQERLILGRLKELWYYVNHMFPGAERELKQLNKARSLSDYESAVGKLFASGRFDPDAAFPGALPE